MPEFWKKDPTLSNSDPDISTFDGSFESSGAAASWPPNSGTAFSFVQDGFAYSGKRSLGVRYVSGTDSFVKLFTTAVNFPAFPSAGKILYVSAKIYVPSASGALVSGANNRSLAFLTAAAAGSPAQFVASPATSLPRDKWVSVKLASTPIVTQPASIDIRLYCPLAGGPIFYDQVKIWWEDHLEPTYSGPMSGDINMNAVDNNPRFGSLLNATLGYGKSLITTDRRETYLMRNAFSSYASERTGSVDGYKNRIPNPNLLTDTYGWVSNFATVTRSSTSHDLGGYAISQVPTVPFGGATSSVTGTFPTYSYLSASITVQLDKTAIVPHQVTFIVQALPPYNDYVIIYPITMMSAGEIKTLAASGPIPLGSANVAKGVNLLVLGPTPVDNSISGVPLFVSKPIITSSYYSLPYGDGDTPGWVWDGTPRQSAATKLI